MKTFQEFVDSMVEARTDYKRDSSNPNLLKSVSGNLNINTGDKVKVKKYRSGKLVATTSYTLSKNQTLDDLVKALNDQNTNASVEYKK